MGGGDHVEQTLTYFQHLKEIFLESHEAETIDAQHLHKISAKEISQDFFLFRFNLMIFYSEGIIGGKITNGSFSCF